VQIKLLEKQEKVKPKSSSWKEIIKVGEKLMQWILKEQYK
jgi:hypothetical protein